MMEYPPSIGRMVPVTKEAALEHKKATTYPTSCGSPILFSGVYSLIGS